MNQNLAGQRSPLGFQDLAYPYKQVAPPSVNPLLCFVA